MYVADRECKPLKILGKEKKAWQKSDCHKGSKSAETYTGRTQAESVRICQSQYRQSGTGNFLYCTGRVLYGKIESNPLWELAGVYADEGISGTNVKHRDEFQMMISDCEDGNIDLILTKSITRFARNTVECIQTIRKLKEIGVGIYFEKRISTRCQKKASCSLPSWHRWRRGNQKTSQATTAGRYRNAFRMEPISYPRQRMAMEKTRMEI